MQSDHRLGNTPHPAPDSVPSVTIRNGLVEATLYPPDPESGYYRGSRFDWSGVVGRLVWRGHEYIAPWFPSWDPRRHDSILGPAEAFAPLGFDAARPGETFLAIGIGTLLRDEAKPYRFDQPYAIVDSGRWTTAADTDSVEFTHELDAPGGYAYRYRKTVRLAADAPRMTLEHALRNTGTIALITSVLNHNFFTLDGQPTGPALSIAFPFELQPLDAGRGFGELADLRGRRITYRRELEPGEIVANDFRGFGDSAADYDIRLENSETHAGLRIRADRPLHRLYFWSIRTTACLEPYIQLQVEPGTEFTWTIDYELYETREPG